MTLRSSHAHGKMVLLSHPDMYDMKHDILNGPQGEKFVTEEVSWKSFEDGLPNLFIKNVKSLRNRDVVFLGSISNVSTIFEQLSLIYALPGYLARSLTLVLPYFCTGTMERVDEEGQIATAMTLARLMCATPPAAMGPAKVVIYDIHALQERFYFNNVLPVLVTAIDLFLLELQKDEFASQDITIAFPDEGAEKRFGKRFAGLYPTVVCHKVRLGTERVVTLKDGGEHIAGRHLFIVDDMVKSGGTLIECSNTLQKMHPTAVSFFVTHGVFPKESYKKFQMLWSGRTSPKGGNGGGGTTEETAALVSSSPSPSSPSAEIVAAVTAAAENSDEGCGQCCGGCNGSAVATAVTAGGVGVGGDGGRAGRTPVESHFYVTDSIPSMAKKLKGLEPFRVLSLGEHVAKHLLDIHNT